MLARLDRAASLRETFAVFAFFAVKAVPAVS